MATLKTTEKEQRKHNHLPTIIFSNSKRASQWVAKEISHLIKLKQENGENCILGLATGSSPIEVYKELVRIHKEEGLSFKNVITFNLDEYFPMKPTQLQSYVHFMNKHLFNHIDIPKENINIPDGTMTINKVSDYCKLYEQKIKFLGGIDLQLLGIGRTGHVGFNEPGSGINSPTRLISLDNLTLTDAADNFGSIKNVPKQAITMGVGTIMKAKRIILMAWGGEKASIIKKTIEDNLTENIPATYLQKHQNTEVILDNNAAKELERE